MPNRGTLGPNAMVTTRGSRPSPFLSLHGASCGRRTNVLLETYINLLRSCPLRRTCSAYPLNSQPFSAPNFRRGNYLLGEPSRGSLLSLLSVTFFFFGFPQFFLLFRCFIFPVIRVRVLLYAFFFVSTKTRLLMFSSFSSFFLCFVFRTQATRKDKARQQ